MAALRLETVWFCEVEPAVDTVTDEATQIVFRFELRGKTALAGERNIMPVVKVYVAFPRPQVGIQVSAKNPDKGLVAVRVCYFVPAPLFGMGFHAYHSSPC